MDQTLTKVSNVAGFITAVSGILFLISAGIMCIVDFIRADILIERIKMHDAG